MPAPANPTAAPASATSITLTWQAAAGASHYDIERNGVVIATDVTGLSYTDTSATLSAEHDYRVRAVYATAPGFSPSDIAGLVGWWDASDAATITASGGDVSQWDDKSASGLDVVQAGSNKPRTGDATQNGLNVLSFASGDWLKVTPGTPICGSAFSIFVVFRKTGTANTYECFPVTLTAGTASRPFDGWDGNRYVFDWTFTGALDISTQTAWTQVSAVAVRTGNTYVERKDGAEIFSTSGSGAGGTTSQVITIGSRDDGVTLLTGDVAEILVYDVELTGTDLASVENYLRAKWGTPLFTGGTITTPGDGYVYHTFTTSGTLTPIGDPVEVEYLVVAGGGGGGGENINNNVGGGGGGAGGMLTGTATVASAQTVTIGAGGAGATTNAVGATGSATSLGAISASGGGGGATWGVDPAPSGGSGGGGVGGAGGANGAGGSPVAGQGSSGGTGLGSPTPTDRKGGGGGGKSASGGAPSGNTGGAGGAGEQWPAASGTYYAGGGGGRGRNFGGPGGLGGGGAGSSESGNAASGTANTGGGGGGYAKLGGAGGTGGSGITIVRYPVDYAWSGNPDLFWFDASDTASITESAGLVSAWGDLTPNGFDLAEAANRPTTNATTKNSLNVIDFDNTDYLTASAAGDWKFTTDGTPWTFYSVARYVSGTMYLCGTGPVGAAVQWTYLGVSGDAYTAAHNGTTTILEGASGWTAGTWAIVCLRLDIGNATLGDRVTINVNGGANVKPNTRSGSPSGSNPSSPLRVGRAPSGTAYQLTGSIGELRGYSALHSDAMVAEFMADLNAKWAVY